MTYCHTKRPKHTSTLQGHMWLSGWVMWKVAKGPGFEPSTKGRVSSKGPKLVFCIRVYVGATSVWGSSCVASISFHSHIDHNKVLKICGAQGPVCLPHAGLVSGSKLCPTKWRPTTFAHLNLWMWEPVTAQKPLLLSLTLKKKARWDVT